jgi:integrase
MTTVVARRGIDAVKAAGKIANQYAAANTFDDYVARKSENTKRAQRSDLAVWGRYLYAVTNGTALPDVDALLTTPSAWEGVTWGLVKGFVKWMLAEGYAIGTINRLLATVRIYCKLALQAGVIDATEAALISTVKGYGGQDAVNRDKERSNANVPTRQGTKKAKHVSLTDEQVKVLKAQPDTPQGRRDALLMALLLDHGLRVGEVAILTVDSVDLTPVAWAKPKDPKEESPKPTGHLEFYRPKVDKTQRHHLTPDTHDALVAYMLHDAPDRGALLFRQSVKGGQLKTGSGISERNLTERVRTLGKRIGIPNLSAHDCRHTWARRAVKGKTDAFALRDAGGWASLAMPSRYVEAAAIANERVTLG